MTKITQNFDISISHFSKKWRIAHYIPRLTSILGLSFFVFLFTALIPNNSLSAAARYCQAVAGCQLNGSNWNTSCTLGGGLTVGAGDDVIICSGQSAVSSTGGGIGSISINSLTIESGAQFGVSKNDTVRIAGNLTSNSGNYSVCRATGPGTGVCDGTVGNRDATLLVLGNVINNATTTVNMKFNGLFQMQGNLTNSNAVTWNNDPAPINSPTVEFNTPNPGLYLITSGGVVLPRTIFAPSVAASFRLQDNFAATNSGGAAITINANATLNTNTNFTIDVAGDFDINGGILVANGSQIDVKGNMILQAGGTFNAGTSTVRMLGVTNITSETFYVLGFVGPPNAFYNLEIVAGNTPDDIIKPEANPIIVKNNLTVTSGVFSTDDRASPGTSRNLNITGNFTHNGGISSFNSSVVTIGGNYSQSAGTVNLQDSTVTVSGGWVGGFNPDNSTVVFNSTSTGNNINASGVFFNNLEFNGAGGGWNLLNWLGATGSFQLNNGTVNQANNFIYARGNVSQTSGTITATTGLMYFDGTANQRVLTNFTAPRVSLQTTTARRITFASGSTFTVTNQFTAKGASGPNRLQLCSDNGAGNCGAGTWNLNVQGTKTSAAGDFDWLDIANSDASSSIAGAKPILASFGNNLNNGVNVDWFPDIIYVRTPGDGGSDANPGSPALPKATIRNAIETICPAPPCSGKEVRVAGGLYTVTYGTDQIQLREGVSLYGGYDPANWATRNVQTFATRVQDTIAVNGTIGAPNRPIESTTGAITSATVIDGFYFEASPTNDWGVGFFVSNGAPIIRNNVIFGGQVGPRHALHITGGSPAVHNNMLHGGTGTQTRGLYLSGGFPTIRSNTIFAGTGANRFPVMLDGGSAGSDIQNNAIFCNAGGQGIRENTATATPAVVRNNAMLDCPAAYFDSSTVPPAAGSIAGVANMEADLVAEGQTASGNIQMASPFTDPDGPDNDYATLLDNDFTFTNPQTANLLQGGIDGNAAGWGFNTDLSGTARTNTTPQSPNNANAQGWTIGAYENDGAATIPPTPVYYTRLSGLWSTATNWSTTACNGPPAASAPPINADIFICNTHSIDLDTAITTTDLTIGTGAGSASLNTTVTNYSITVKGNLVIGNGGGAASSETLTANNSLITVEGDFTIGDDGQYIPGTSSLSFTGTGAQTLTYGGPAQPHRLQTHNLEIRNGGRTVTIASGSIMEIANSLNFSGDDPGARLALVSSAAPAWQIDVNMGMSANLVELTNSDASPTGGPAIGDRTITAYNSIDNGGNTDWVFQTALYTRASGDFANSNTWTYADCFSGGPRNVAGIVPDASRNASICNADVVNVTGTQNVRTLNMDGGGSILNLGTATLNVHERLYRWSSATFNANTGTIVMNGTSSQFQQIYGADFTFYNLTIPANGGGRTVEFERSRTYTVTNIFDASGLDSSNKLILRGGGPAGVWNLVLNGSITSAGFLDVQDSSASGTALAGAPPTVLNVAQTATSVDNGGNTGWFALLPGHYFVSTGNWSTLANWRTDGCAGAAVAGSLPTSSDDVFICSGQTATLDVVGNTQNFTNNGTVLAGSQTLNISGNALNSGAFTAGSSTVNLTGTGTIDGFDLGASALYNVSIASATHTTTLLDTVAINNSLIIGAGTVTGSSASACDRPLIISHLNTGLSTRLTIDPSATLTDRVNVAHFVDSTGYQIPGGNYGDACIFILGDNQTATLTGNVSTTGFFLLGGDLSVASQTGTLNTNGFTLTTGGMKLGTDTEVGTAGNGALVETGAPSNEVFQTGNLQLLAGSSLTLNDADFRISGSLDNAGTLTAGSSTIRFNGAASSTQQIVGNNTFFNLDLPNNGARNIEFATTSTTTVNGSFSASGTDAANRLVLRPNPPAGNFNFNLAGSKGTLQFLDVSNSNASGSTGLLKPLLTGVAQTTSNDGGGNTDWFPVGGLVAHWQLDDVAGSIADSAGSNTGTATGTAVAQNRQAVNQTAKSFNGTTDFITIPAAAPLNLGTGSFTMAAWVKKNVNGSGMVIMTQGATVANQIRTLAFTPTNNISCGFFANDLNTIDAFTDTSRWHHIACTYNTSTNARSIYYDGALVDSDFAPLDTTATGTWYIGQQVNNTERFNGNIDDVRIYNYSLSAGEILSVYNTKKWDGGGDAVSWNSPANWVPDGVPAAGDDVILDDTYVGGYTVNLPGAAVTVGNLEVSGASPPTLNTNTQTLTVNHHFDHLAGTITGGGTLQLAGTTDGDFRFYSNGSTLNTNVNVNSGAGKNHDINGPVILNGNLSLNNGQFRISNHILTTNSILFTAVNGALHNGSGTINVANNWDNAIGGTFTTGTGTVNFNGTGGTQNVTGNNTFNNLSFADTGARTISLPAGGTQTVAGTFNANAPVNGVALQSSVASTQTTITVNGSLGTFDNLTIQDNVINGTAWSAAINPPNSLDVGNNTGWFGPTSGPRYVRTTGSDTANNCLTPASPCATIQHAITEASAGDEVRVAGGTYNVDSSIGSPTHIILKEGVDLLGGYDPANFAAARDPVTHLTTITDLNSLNGANAKAIYANTGITNATLIDGFTIVGGGGTVSAYAVLIEGTGSPTISNNTINCGVTTGEAHGINITAAGSSSQILNNTIACNNTGGGWSIGIANNDGDTNINGNSITATGTGPSAGINHFNGNTTIVSNPLIGAGANSTAYGIRLLGGTPTITNNANINGGTGGTNSYGILAASAACTNVNCVWSGNTISGGAAANSFGIRIENGGDPLIDNSTAANIITGGTGGTQALGIYVTDVGTNPTITGNSITGNSAATTGGSYGVFITSSATATITSNNPINGGTNNSASGSWGIQIESSVAGTVISGNTINGGISTATRGIYVVSGATPAIDASVAANTINGGAPTTAESVGILISGAGTNPVISGNSINGGGGGTASFGINVQSDADPTIQNNTSISGGTGAATVGIEITGAGTDPTIGGAGNGNTLITGGAATGGSSYAINVLAGASPTITENAEINGGTSSTGNTEAIHIDNSTVSITGNLLNGGATSVAGNDAIGINAVGTSGGSIERNRIFAGTALAGGNSTIAINLPGSGTFSVNNNLVSGGQGTNGSSGLYLAGSATVTVRNNTIHTGTAGTASRGVYLVSNNSVTVQNNLIVCTGAAATNIIGFEEAGGATEPSVFRNNNLSDCSTALYRDNNATNITGTSDALDTGEGAGTLASYGNISIAPSFVDFDGADNTSSTSDDFAGTNWDMAAGGVATNQAQGGLDLSGSGITTDIAGNARTNLGGGQNDGPTNTGANGFTMGAFEDETPALSAPATMYSRASGNYNDPNTWSGSACGGAQPATFASPVATTNVIVCDGTTVTLTTAAAANNLNIGSNTAAAAATLDTSASNFALNINGNLTIGDGDATFAGAGVLQARNSTITVSGNWTRDNTDGTFDRDPAGSTVILNGSGSISFMSLQNVNGPNSFWNLSLAFPTFTTNSNNVLRVYNQLTMNGGTFSNAGVLHLHNEASSTTDTPLLLGGTTLANTGNIEFHFLKDALGKIQGGNYFTKNIIIKTSTGNTSTLQAPITAMGDLTIQGNSGGQIASFDTANSNITANSLSIGTIQSAAVNFGTSNLNIAGDVLISDAAANPDPTLLTSGGTWTIGGNFTNISTASIDFSGSTVSFNGTGNQTLTGTTTFNNLTLDGTATPARTVTFPVGSSITVSGQFQAWGNAGGVLSLRSPTPTQVAGIVANGTLGTFDYLDVQDHSLTGTAVASPVNPSNSTDSGNNTGWFSPAAGATLYSYGSGLYSNGALWTSANCAAGALVRTLGVLSSAPAATNNVVICNGNAMTLTAPTTANSIIIEAGSISTNTANHALTITTDLTIGDGAGGADTARLFANAAVISVAGNVNVNTVDGQYVRGTSTLRLTGAAVANLNIANTATTSDLNRLEITGGGTWNLGTNLTIFDDALSIANGNLNHTTFDIILEGADFVQSGGAIASTTGQVILGGAGGTLTQSGGTFGSIMRYNTNNPWTLATNFVSTSAFIKDNSGTFDMAGFDFAFGGDYTMNLGTFTAGTGTLSVGGNFTITAGTFTANTSTLTLTGTAARTLTSNGASFNHVTLNGTGGTYTMQDALTAVGNLTVTQGTLDVNGANHPITITGDITLGNTGGAANSATLNARASTITTSGSFTQNTPDGRYQLANNNRVVMNGNGTITGMANTTSPGDNMFYYLDIAYPTFTTTKPGTILVMEQTTLNGGTFVNSAQQIIHEYKSGASVSITPLLLNSSTITGTGTINISCQKNNNCFIDGGNYGTNNVLITGTNVASANMTGDVIVGNNLTIRGSGGQTSTLNTANNNLIIGGNLLIGLATNPGALNTGTSNLDINGNLTINNIVNSITASGGTWNLAGNFTNNSTGVLNFSGTTFTLDGAAAQTVSGTQGVTFNNLTLQTAAGGKTITFQDGNTYTVGGTLTAAGTAGNLLTLNSVTPGNQTTITVNGPALVAANYSFLRIQDHVLNGTAWSTQLDPASSTNLGNTMGWFPATLLYTRVTGNWTNGNTWSELGCGLAAYGSPPPAGMDVQICNGHTITVDAATATIDDLTHTAGGTLTVDNALNLNGNLNIGGTSTTNGTNAINITGAGTSTLIATAPLANTNIDINIADGTRTLAGNFATGNALNILAGTLDTSVTNYTLQAGSYSFTTGTLNANASSIITNGSFQNFGATLNMGTSTLELRGTPNGVANNYNLQTNASTLANILLDNVGEATTNFDTFTLSDALSITGNLTIRDNTFDTNSANDYAVNIVGNLAIGDSTPAPNTAVFNANSSNVTVTGNWVRDANDGTFNRDNGQIVNLTGTGNVSGMTAIGGTANNFYTLSAASAGQTTTHPGTDTLVVMNQLILNGGTFAENSAAQPFNGAVLPNKTFLVKDASSVAPSVLSATANSTITGNNFTVLCNSTPCSIPGNTSGANTIAWNNTSLSFDVSNGATIQLLNPITIAGNLMIFSSTAPIGTLDINGNAVNAVNLRIGWDEAAQPTWDANLINTGASASVTLSSNMNIEPGSQLNNTNMPLTLTGILTNTGSIDLNQNITAANIFNPATMNVNTNATIVTGAGSLLVNNAASTLNIADGVTLTMDGNLSHSDGAITLGGGTSGTLDLKRNFTKSGGTITINAGSTLSATGISNQSIDVTGGLALQNFTLNNTSGALRTVAFTAGETFSVAGDFNAAGGGSAASRLALASLTPGTQLNLNINGTFNAANDWLQVSDVDATGSGVATPLFASLGNNSNGGNSPGWFPLTILYSRLTGNWTAPATWSDVACSGATAGGPLPTATVDVEICTGHTVTVNSAGTTAQDMLISGGTLDRQDFAPAVRNFAITGGNVTVSGAIHWMPVSGNMVLTAGNAGFRYRPDSPTGTISQTSATIGAIEFRGNYTLTTDLTLGALYTATGGTVNLDGFDLVATGAGATQNATDNVNVGTGNLTLNGPFTMNGGTITVTTGNINVADLNLNAGSNVNLGSGTFSISGDLTNAGTINPGTALVQLTSAGANRTITTGPVTLDRVNVATTGGFAAILGNNLSILNDLTVSSGELQTGTFNLNVGGNVVQTGGVLTVSDTTTLAADGLNKSAGTLNLGPTGNSILTINSNWSHTGGTIVAAAGDTINGAITNATRGFYRPTFAVGDLIPNNPAAFGYYFDPTGTADAVRIQITEPNRNLDAGLAESFNVTLETNAGTTDTLVVTMNETSMNSGIFQSAAIVGRIIGVAPGAIPAEIEAVIGDVLRFTDTDPFNPADTLLVETQVTDATAAAVATRTTRDTDGDGRVDRLEFTFATPVNRGCGDVVVSITDYPGPMNFGDCTGTGTTFHINLDQTVFNCSGPTADLCTNNTGWVPNIQFTAGAMLIADGAPLPATDGAAPVAIATKPKVGQSVAEIIFSEPVQRIGGGSVTLSDVGYTNISGNGVSLISGLSQNSSRISLSLNTLFSATDNEQDRVSGAVGVLEDAAGNALPAYDLPMRDPDFQLTIAGDSGRISDNYIDFRKRTTATVAVNISQGGEVKIDLLDMRGRRLQTIHQNSYSSGTHLIEWNVASTNVGAGLYFLYIQGPGWSKPKIEKLMIVR